MDSHRTSIDQLHIRQLLAIYEVGKQGSLAGASEALFLTQPAVTQSLRRAENILGTHLFERKARGSWPTAAGTALIYRIGRAINYLKAFQCGEKTQGKSRQIYRSLTNAQLRALVGLAEHGSYSIAASKLGVSQPSLHRSISELQGLLGETLFERTAQGVIPRPRARMLARKASLAMSEIRQGLEDIRAIEGNLIGQLSIGCLPMARTDLLPESLQCFLADYPDASIRLMDGPYEEQLHALLHGDLDLIIGALRDPAPTRELAQEPLFDDPLGVIVRAGHPALAHDRVSLSDLSKMEWIAPRVNTPTRAIFASLFKAEALPEPLRIIECSSLIAIRGLLTRSNRAALVSVRQVRPELESGLLATLPCKLQNCSRPIGISTRKDWEPTKTQKDYLQILHSCSERLMQAV